LPADVPELQSGAITRATEPTARLVWLPDRDMQAAPADTRISEEDVPKQEPSVHNAPVPPSEIRGFADIRKDLALRRAVARQERAQIKTARAMRMLLQLLDGSSNPVSSAAAHAMLVSAAQESAATEAEEARKLFDAALDPENQGGTAHREAAAPENRRAIVHPPFAGRLAGSDS
jgi:hypothetical protein